MSPDNRHKICVFCNDPEDNEIKYGKIYEHNGIITHYYCLLLSSNMQQRGEDDEGILGFLPADINRELNRGKKLVCSFCKRKGATLGCVNKKCKKVFHLPCGLRNNTLHQFFDQFKSFCQTHRPKQHIELNILKSTSERTTCWICFDSASRHDIYKTLWAPCCKKNAWFHRDCVQQLALSAGYFFKCPLCNNKKEFQSAMQECGIFVPSQDASWELVPNAFQELLYRHNRCDAAECKCPQGRDFTSGSSWQMVLCRTCGSQGTHLICGNLRWAKTWDCRDCQSILSKKFTDNTARFNGNSHIDSSNDVSIDSDDDQDHSLSSSSSRTIDIAAINLKPGPRSAKLKQLHQTAKQLPEPATFEQLKNILDEQQAQSSQSQISQVFQVSQSLKITQKSEEEEISILEVKSKPQNSPDKLIQVNKYPELSISPRKSLPEASNINQNVCNKPESRLISIPGTSVQSRMSLPVSTASPIQPERALVAPTRPKQSLLKINQKPTTQSPLKPKIVEDIIVVDSDDESEQAKTPGKPIESRVELNQPVVHDLEPEDGIMNIKITEVTSLAPEVFAQVPDNSIINLPGSIDNFSDNSTPITTKRKADSPSIISTFVNRVNDVIDTNARELELASLPSKKTKCLPSTVTTPTPAPSNPSNFSTGMTRIVPPPNYMINNSISYNRGISLANSAVVKVYDKQYIVPLENPTSKDQISYDGDAGSEPACEFTLPTTTTTTTTTADVAEQSVPETHSSLSPSPPCSSASAPTATAREQLSTGIRTSRAEQNFVSTLEGLSTSAGNNTATSLSNAARTRITRTKKFNPPTDQRNSPRSDRFGLDQKILLQNLKFRVCSDNSLEITAYDNYRMNLGINGPKLSPSTLGIVSGLSNVCVVKPRSSRVRGPKSKRMKYEMENLLSNSIIDNTDNLFGASASGLKAPTNPVAIVTPHSGNTSEYNYHQTAKENLIPKLNHLNFDNDKQSEDHADDYKLIGRKLRSSKFLEDIQYNNNSDSINSFKSEGINVVNNQNNILKDQPKISCFVSIDLNRIKPLIDSKPNLFFKKTLSFDKLFHLNDNEFFKLNQTNGKLKRSYSCDSIFPINISSQSQTISTTTSATVSNPIEENNKEEKEIHELSQKSRKRKRGRSFKNSSRVR